MALITATSAAASRGASRTANDRYYPLSWRRRLAQRGLGIALPLACRTQSGLPGGPGANRKQTRERRSREGADGVDDPTVRGGRVACGGGKPPGLRPGPCSHTGLMRTVTGATPAEKS